MPYKLGTISISDTGKSTSVGDVFVIADENKENSSLFALVAIQGNGSREQSLVSQTLNLANEAYQQFALQEPEKRLESILTVLNEQLPLIFKASWQKIASNFNACIGLIEDEQIYFSLAGNVRMYLLQPNLVKDLTELEDPERSNIFNNTLNGKIKDYDRLLFTTPSLTDYLSLEKIKKIVTTLPLHNAIAHLNNILEAVPATTSFFSLIVKVASPANPTLEKISPLKSKDSLDQMLEIQQETVKILTPPNLVDTLKQHFLRKWQTKLSGIRPNQILQPNYLEKFKSGVKTTARYTVIISKKIARGAKIAWRSPLTKEALRYLAFLVAPLRRKFNSLDKRQKYLVIGVLICLLLLTEGVIWTKQNNQTLKANEAYQVQVKEIEDKGISIETSIIFNPTQAKQLLGEAETLLNALPQGTKDKDKKYAELKAKLSGYSDQIWKVTNLTDPEVITDFKDIISTAQAKSMSVKDAFLYVFTDGNQVFTFNTVENKNVLLDSFEQVNKATFFPKNNFLVVAATNNQFYKITENEKVNIPIDLPTDLKNIDDLAFFGSNLYILDKQAGQIWRLPYADGKFSGATGWLKEKVDLNNTVSMAINGSVYLLQNNGGIIKLKYNKKETSANLDIMPALKNPNKIWTTENSERVYILDRSTQRLVVMNTAGQIITQFRSDKFNDLKDLVVKEKEKTVYLLNGTQIFKIALP
jgi:hypothetical protein